MLLHRYFSTILTKDTKHQELVSQTKISNRKNYGEVFRKAGVPKPTQNI